MSHTRRIETFCCHKDLLADCGLNARENFEHVACHGLGQLLADRTRRIAGGGVRLLRGWFSLAALDMLLGAAEGRRLPARQSSPPTSLRSRQS